MLLRLESPFSGDDGVRAYIVDDVDPATGYVSHFQCRSKLRTTPHFLTSSCARIPACPGMCWMRCCGLP
eukprot:8734901-Karenia_brevis.AAC.1